MNSPMASYPYHAVRPLLIVFPPPGFNLALRFLQRQQPVLVEALIPKLAIEAFDQGILDRFPWLNKVEVHAVLRDHGKHQSSVMVNIS